MERIIEIPEGYEARIEGNKVVIEPKSEDEEFARIILDLPFKHEADRKFVRAYLEKLKAQKPAEWGEEDEKMRNNLIEFLIRLSANTRTDSTSINYSYPREIAWLKSLRPRSCWKPSEEQMEWLESAVKLSTDKPGIHGIILSLYEQLKRL